MRVKADMAAWMAVQHVLGRVLESLAPRRASMAVGGDWGGLMALHSLHGLHGRICAATHKAAFKAPRQLAVKVEAHEAAALMATAGTAEALITDEYISAAWRQLQTQTHASLINQ